MNCMGNKTIKDIRAFHLQFVYFGARAISLGIATTSSIARLVGSATKKIEGPSRSRYRTATNKHARATWVPDMTELDVV